MIQEAQENKLPPHGFNCETITIEKCFLIFNGEDKSYVYRLMTEEKRREILDVIEQVIGPDSRWK